MIYLVAGDWNIIFIDFPETERGMEHRAPGGDLTIIFQRGRWLNRQILDFLPEDDPTAHEKSSTLNIPGLVNVYSLRTWKWWFRPWIYPLKMVICSIVMLPEGILLISESCAYRTRSSALALQWICFMEDLRSGIFRYIKSPFWIGKSFV